MELVGEAIWDGREVVCFVGLVWEGLAGEGGFGMGVVWRFCDRLTGLVIGCTVSVVLGGVVVLFVGRRRSALRGLREVRFGLAMAGGGVISSRVCWLLLFLGDLRRLVKLKGFGTVTLDCVLGGGEGLVLGAAIGGVRADFLGFCVGECVRAPWQVVVCDWRLGACIGDGYVLLAAWCGW